MNDRHTPPRYASAAEVARLAGVSRSAVSRAFTPGASISETTRKRVMQAAQALGYQVNDLARALLNQHSRLVGLVVTDPAAGFRAHLVAALTQALVRRGSVPVVINTGRTEAEMLAAHQALAGYRAEATVLLSGSPPASFLDLARRTGQKLVVVGRSEPGAAHVLTDNQAAAREAAQHFIGLGCLRLGLAGSASGTPNIVEREQAFLAHAHALGAEVWLARGADADYAGGQRAAQALLAQCPALQGVFCVNDLIACGLMDELRMQGLRVPQDVAVIGFDDIPEAAWASYRLTTFRQDPALLAAEIVRLLDTAHGTGPRAIRLRAPLILRESA
ncbi:MAG: transcriptional regulator [Candidatus Dactylopiibacterium carminicum]|uniref:Transcriptional regulator n=1 Tax=Candidatus Dactylopiibacterium carminicum TaxID=857335 RepID=A0A272ETE5_9RHOO|nr:LacI family DNA-binding transcriptional regulator [Candidatus Dactylopiibacterium carminicum]KAF7599373.1 transcriptional regulator [Candidatus Dactylopiibacterium carminicum]PAS93383.1 MAG: transcriptional regulator [Candidatus Dactylopiibacterium carminicum]PAS98336.1 MAG: transcriptional regulator [Candidatus Dactylopiibacterium carminicum]